MRRLLIPVLIVLFCAVPAQGSIDSIGSLRKGVEWQRQATWYWQDIALVKRTPTGYAERKTSSRAYLKWTLRKWKERKSAAITHAANPPHLREWLCIYGYENGGYGWTANTGNGYYGGLQMDLDFQRAYGWNALQRWGTANNWHPLTQMWVASRAHRGYNGIAARGFYPWPNTARYCGLI